MIPAKLALVMVSQLIYKIRMLGTTYKMPAANTAETLSFFWMGSLRCQIVQSGKSRIRKSDRTLMVPVTMKLRFVAMNFPGRDAFHAFGTGWHWKMTDSTLAK